MREATHTNTITYYHVHTPHFPTEDTGKKKRSNERDERHICNEHACVWSLHGYMNTIKPGCWTYAWLYPIVSGMDSHTAWLGS